MNAIWQGLSLSVLGIGLTFAALGLLILGTFVLERIFRTRRLIPDKHDLEEGRATSTLTRDTQEEEIVAAIAIALAHVRSLDMSRSGLGEALEAGRGPWGMRQLFSSHVRQPPSFVETVIRGPE